jgi:hypothetical protein
LIVLLGLMPVAGYAQTPPTKVAPPPAKAAEAQPVKGAEAQPAKAAEAPAIFDDSQRLLTIGLAAIAGTVVMSVISANFISSTALANLGKGAVVFVGTVGGGLVGNWLVQH